MARAKDKSTALDSRSRTIVVTNLYEGCTEDNLTFFFESERHWGRELDVEKCVIDESGPQKKAYITFKTAKDVKVVQERPAPEFKGRRLTVAAAEEDDGCHDPYKAVIRGLPDKCSSEMVQNFLESRKVFRKSVDVQYVDINESERTALVTFASVEDAAAVVAKGSCEMASTTIYISSATVDTRHGAHLQTPTQAISSPSPAVALRSHYPTGVYKDHGHSTWGSRQEMRILLIGKTGVGKSSVGNALLGREAFEVDHTDQSGTDTCSKQTERRFHRNIVVVDTPGFFDTREAQKKETVRKEIFKSLALVVPGFHILLFVMKPEKLTAENKASIELMYNMFDKEKVCRYVYILLNHWDSKESDDGIKFEEYLQKSGKDFREFRDECGKRVALFSCRYPKDRQEANVRSLLDEFDNMIRQNRQGQRSISHFTHPIFTEIRQGTDDVDSCNRQDNLDDPDPGDEGATNEGTLSIGHGIEGSDDCPSVPGRENGSPTVNITSDYDNFSASVDGSSPSERQIAARQRYLYPSDEGLHDEDRSTPPRGNWFQRLWGRLRNKFKELFPFLFTDD